MSDFNTIPVEQQNWKPIPGFADTYEISEYGIIRRTTNGKNRPVGSVVRPAKDKNGYHFARLWNRDTQESRTASVHRLVMLAFVGEPPEGHEVNHKDGNKTNNHISNLEYMTHYENIIHSFRELNRMETVARGESASQAKLTEPQIIQIRERAAKGETRRALGDEFKVSHVAITQIVNRKTWRHVS